MKRSSDRILTSHTGSLPRPPELVDLHVRRARGERVDDAMRDVGRAAVRNAVARQAEVGLDVVNDGEQQREGFFQYVQRRMSGFGGEWNRPPVADFTRYPLYLEMVRKQWEDTSGISRSRMPMAIGEVRYGGTDFIQAECTDLKAAADTVPGIAELFMNAPSPGIVASAMKNAYYDSERSYLAALAEALRTEYEAIVASGFVLQIDAPELALDRQVRFNERPLSEFLAFAEAAVDALNGALRNIPADRVRMHACWGNFEGPHDCDVPLAEILPILRQARVEGLVLPFANPAHAHEYRVLSNGLGDHQIVIAGVIDPLTNFVEHPEVVAERIEHVVHVVGDPGRVLAGTDCGFDTAAGGGRVAPDVVWAKFGSLVAGARIASQRVFG